ncbi:MAG: DNA-3-methyladenine glycosylase 2 family protein [bacterium]|jgi:DNA-3-methyladenine glycosylase II|nr:DNA-3-methyladenine glycosylase 2 family protein [bacterium]
MPTLTQESLATALRELPRRDAAFRPWLKRVDEPRLPPRRPPFQTLADAILSQQVSGAAAETICRRTFALCHDPRRPAAADLRRLCDTEEGRAALRAAGVSPQKLGYLDALAHAFSGGPLERFPFARRPDEEIVAALTAVKGIGRWTAEMFLIFGLRRPDVFSPGDLGLRKGVARLYDLDDPSPAECARRAEAWIPWRSVASLVLWRVAGWKAVT